MKVVINACFGGFQFSDQAAAALPQDLTFYRYDDPDGHWHRHDPDLVAVIERLGPEANTQVSELKVIEIPDGVDYVIEEYDGVESVHERHHVWG